ncbi:SusC/RagA family TonB-linked outer membrane protein [Prolixibacteraceae bacterium]|nr:SusC/RagA family TonB-linked outer membrane protein [Prolixibacteraceae bacterium]
MKKHYSLFLLLLLFCSSWSLSAQETRTIHGVVFDAVSGETLPGASIFLDNTVIGVFDSPEENTIANYSQGTVSNVNGVFSLKVPKGAEFVTCSFVGYQTKKYTIPASGKLVIHLSSDVSDLEEVVVTGYQNIKERKLTASVVKLKTDDIIQASVPSIDQMLAGQLAGVQTTVTSGAPGAPAKIRIRGNASLSGSQDPLWVVDGVPLTNTDLPDVNGQDISDIQNSSIAGLNPNDIANITVLKDAAATAIYGARASNGVIVVTTKKGKKGKVNVNINSNVSFVQRPDINNLNLLNAGEKVDLELKMAKTNNPTRYGQVNGEIYRILSASNELESFKTSEFSALKPETQDKINALRTTGSDWGREIYQSAVNQNHNISVSGGSDVATYYVSMGHYDEKGTTIGTGLNRTNITMRTDFNVARNLKIGMKVLANRRKNTSFLSASSYSSPNVYSRNVNPYVNVYNDLGEYVYDQDSRAGGSTYYPYNFVEEREGTMNDLTSVGYMAQLDLDWKIIKGLNFRSTFGYQYDQSLSEKRADVETFFNRELKDQTRYYKNGKKTYLLPEGQIRKNLDRKISQWNIKNMLEYNGTFNNVHELDVMVGNEIRHDETAELGTNRYGVNPYTLVGETPLYRNTSDVALMPTGNESFYENAFVSYFATANYSFDRRYSIFGSIRTDASNIFGKDVRDLFVPLWAVGSAWNINEESFYNLDFMNKAKFRMSYGLQGNIDKNTYPFLVGEWNNGRVLGSTRENIIQVSGAPNPDLQWEKTSNIGLGLELGFFKNRLQFTADVYSRYSYDLIGTKELPQETGFSIYSVNWAEVSNKGYELSLTAQIIRSKNFRWNTTFNWSHNKDRVEKIHADDKQYTPSREGFPVNAVFGFKTKGLDDKGMPLYNKDGKGVNVKEFFDLKEEYGMTGFDFNTFTPIYGTISQYDLTAKEVQDRYSYLGTIDPKFTGGIVNSFSYKNLTLYVAANFYLKGLKNEAPFYNLAEFDRARNYTSSIYDIWSPDNTNGKYPAIIADKSEYVHENAAYQPGSMWGFTPYEDLDIWYKEVNYLRISNIRLSYQLPTNFINKLGLGAASVKFEALNPFVFGTDYSGYFDPETYGNIYAQPIPKSYSVGLNLSF